ncbi:MAG: energy transducer TonB [Candidatus Egerieousia sp.]
MELKKTPRASLENKKLLYREIGLIIALAIVLGAFSWSTREKQASGLAEDTRVAVEEEDIPITEQNETPPPEAIKEPVMTEELEIVDNDIKVTTEFISADDNTAKIEIKPYIEAKPVEEEAEEEEIIPFTFVEEKPTFQGGDANTFTKWVYSKIVYPEIAKENGVQGRVTIQFTIDTDGSVKDARVVRGVDSSIDKEALRVINSSPKWKPGRQRNKNVKVKYTFPIVFQLR